MWVCMGQHTHFITPEGESAQEKAAISEKQNTQYTANC